ncbi:MAG: hypothetical protein IT430_15195 [Phycisphaerales bacterium]|nr:hypothetical protein [Phycisphaerales bacterium]
MAENKNTPPLGMTAEQFRSAGHDLIDWIAGYLEYAEQYRVLSPVEPGQVRDAVERPLPEGGEAWPSIWSDFEHHIMPGITHWQSPNFFAYFPANASYPAILGELLSAGLGVNGMLWSSSPAVTELETFVLDWLVELLALPEHFKGAGVIQDTASSASLCALLCGREQALDWRGNALGLSNQSAPLAAYTSDQAHSSIEKAAMIAGIGRENVRLVPSDAAGAMNPDELQRLIAQDRTAGREPCFISATMGTTSSLAMDPLPAIGRIAAKENIWFHVDGAMVGTALACPEFRHIAEGLELADSFCVNPHKWMLTNFDLDAFYVRQPQRLTRTLSILPEYLRAAESDEVINYRDWHIPLGRRFRALKLWFVIRTFGVKGIRRHIREHVRLAGEFAQWVRADDRFELAAPPSLNLVCFRLRAGDGPSEALLHALNRSGRIHLTHTRLNGRYALRFCVGQPRTGEQHVRGAWKLISEAADEVLEGN